MFHKKLTKETEIHCIIVPETDRIWDEITLLKFEEKYYEYGEKGIDTKGLAIDGYGSSFLADLVASYPFEKFRNQFKEFPWKGIYRANVSRLDR